MRPTSHDLAEILVVEPNSADSEFIASALRERGLGQALERVPDGQVAIDYLFRLGEYATRELVRLPRLILLADPLPKRGTLDVLQAVRSDSRLGLVPVVALTASDDPHARLACLEAGASSVVRKPVSPDKFGDIIGQVAIYWLLVNDHPDQPTGSVGERHITTEAGDGTGLRVLLAERDPREADQALDVLRRSGFDVEADVVGTSVAFADHLSRQQYDVVISEHEMDGWTGLDALGILRRGGLDLPFILVTRVIPESEALRYLNEGAADYLYKDRLSRLSVAVRRSLHDRALAQDRRASHDRLFRQGQFREVLAGLGAMALSDLNPAALAAAAVRMTQNALRADAVAFLEVRAEDGRLVLGPTAGWPPAEGEPVILPAEPFRIALAEGTTHQLAPEAAALLPSSEGTPTIWSARVGAGPDRSAGLLLVVPSAGNALHSEEAHFLESVAHLLAEATSRHRTTTTLHLLESAVNHSTEAVMITTADLDPPGPTVVFVNPAFTKLTGYAADEIVGQSPRILQGPGTARDVLEELRTCLSSGRPFSGELLNYRRDGTAYRSELDIAPITGPDGGVTHYVSLQRDVTARRQADERLQQSQKIEAVGRLAGGVAHDFNNLLMTIIGYTALLLRRVDSSDPLHADLREVDCAAQRGATLTQQLLAFSRRQVLQLRIVDLNAVMTDMEPMLHRVLGEDMAVVSRLDDHLGRAKADPTQLQQVLLNLAVNAREAMPGGGHLTIRTSNVTLSEEESRRHHPMLPGRYVQLQVTDTGIGMDDSVLARVFEPFFTTKERGEGTGLGLATAYGIVKQSGGYIYAASTVGLGSTFTIYFPRVDQPVTHTPGAAHRGSDPGAETLLLVEDEDTVRTLIIRVLKERGYTVLAAGTGAEALAVAGAWSGHIDLVISDVIMPEMSGPAMVEVLAGSRPDLRVLFMSGYTEFAFAPEGILGERAEFLQKPFTPDVLLQKVRDVLQRGVPMASPGPGAAGI